MLNSSCPEAPCAFLSWFKCRWCCSSEQSWWKGLILMPTELPQNTELLASAEVLGQPSEINPSHRNHQGEFLCSLKGAFRKCLLPLSPNILELFSWSTNTSVPWVGLQLPWVNPLSWSHLCLSLHNHQGSALFKPHLIMQFNCSKNNSFAEYATVSSLCFDGGRWKEKAISIKVQAFLWGLSDLKKTEASLSGESGVRDIFLACLGCSHSYLNTMAQTLAFFLLIFLQDCSSLTPVTQFH